MSAWLQTTLDGGEVEHGTPEPAPTRAVQLGLDGIGSCGGAQGSIFDEDAGRPLWRVQVRYMSSGEVWWQNVGGAIACHDTALAIAAQRRDPLGAGHVARVVRE